MRPTLFIRVTAERVRVELDGEVLFDEEAALALRYDARVDDAQFCGMFSDAVSLPETIETLARNGQLDDGDRRACIVPVTEAKWWEHVRTHASPQPAPAVPERAEHHGEIIVVHPFADVVTAPLAWVPMLIMARHRALAKEASGHRFARLRRFCMERWARTAIELPALPPDTDSHDKLLRQLWKHFGARLTLDGARPKLRSTKLAWWRWCVIASPIAFVLVMYLLPRNPPPARYAPLFVFGAAALSSLMRRDTLREEDASTAAPEEPHLISTTRAIQRYAAPHPEADRASYSGRGSFRFGATDSNSVLPLPFVAASTVIGVVVVANWIPARLLGALLILLMPVAGYWLGAWLAGARLGLGERGITLRFRGWLSRPLHVPYARIRRVIANGPRLRIVFHDGRELPLGFSWPTARRVRLVRDIEAKLAAQLVSPASYRAPG